MENATSIITRPPLVRTNTMCRKIAIWLRAQKASVDGELLLIQPLVLEAKGR